MELNNRFEKYWHGFFELGIFVKGFNGLWETIVGSFALFFSKAKFSNLFHFLARKELLEDPHDRLIDFLGRTLQNTPPEAKTFAAIYILAHGLLNIFLAVQLFRNKLWAYKLTVVVILMFIAYQIYRIALHHSPVLAAVTIFDALFVALTWHEYRYQTSSLVP